MPGFIKSNITNLRHGQLAKSLASGFLKFTSQGLKLSQSETVQSFIALADLHRELTDEAQAFLQEEVTFVYEDQQIQPLLLNFAAYRLRLASRRYYFGT